MSHGGLLSLSELFSNTNTFCTHCRSSSQDLREGQSTPPLVRCSRCKVIHYCSRECQKLNFSIHKACCKKIHNLRQQLLNDAFSETKDDDDVTKNNENDEKKKKNCQYDLAFTILALGYQSTDTIDRGKSIYECALLEYLKLMRQDPFWIGACESVVLLLSILGYDDLCLSLISFMLHPPPSSISAEEGGEVLALDDREGLIRQYTFAVSDLDADLWIYGNPSFAKVVFSEYDKIRDMIPQYWGANVFLVPLMLIKMRQCCADPSSSLSPPSRKLKMLEAVEISRQVEYSAEFILPVLRSLFPDSRQRWEESEVCGLLAHVDYRKLNSKGDNNWEEDDTPYEDNRWERSCFTFWMMLKDCYAFTPGILDVLEETIDEMTNLGIRVIPEDPDAPTTSEYMDFVKQMAEHQRNGTSPFD